MLSSNIGLSNCESEYDNAILLDYIDRNRMMMKKYQDCNL